MGFWDGTVGEGLIDVRHPAVTLLKNKTHNYLIYRVLSDIYVIARRLR